MSHYDFGAIGFASRTTFLQFSADSEILKVAEGEPIFVNGIIYSNDFGAAAALSTVEMQDNDGNFLMQLSLNRRANTIITIPFVADNGIQFQLIDSDTADPVDLTITIHHSQPGA